MEASEQATKIGAAAIRDRYRGRIAAAYDKRRSRQSKWKAEHKSLDAFLGHIGPGRSVLDIPVGTGRFLALYAKHGLSAIGMDVSEDMLAQARAKDGGADLRLGDALNIALPAASVDVAVCVRFLTWVTAGEMRQVLAELSRVARNSVIVSVRLTKRATMRRVGLARVHTESAFMIARQDAALRVGDVRLIHRAKHGNYFMVLMHRHP